MSLKTFVAASGLQPRDLCGTHIEHPWTSRKGSRAATGLVMGLQQRDIHTIPGQQGGRCESGDATSDHDHAGVVQVPAENQFMLASAMPSRG